MNSGLGTNKLGPGTNRLGMNTRGDESTMSLAIKPTVAGELSIDNHILTDPINLHVISNISKGIKKIIYL